MGRGGGGGGCNVFLTFYAISNIYRKKNLGIQNNYFSFNVFLEMRLEIGRWFLCVLSNDKLFIWLLSNDRLLLCVLSNDKLFIWLLSNDLCIE